MGRSAVSSSPSRSSPSSSAAIPSPRRRGGGGGYRGPGRPAGSRGPRRRRLHLGGFLPFRLALDPCLRPFMLRFAARFVVDLLHPFLAGLVVERLFRAFRAGGAGVTTTMRTSRTMRLLPRMRGLTGSQLAPGASSSTGADSAGGAGAAALRSSRSSRWTAASWTRRSSIASSRSESRSRSSVTVARASRSSSAALSPGDGAAGRAAVCGPGPGAADPVRRRLRHASSWRTNSAAASPADIDAISAAVGTRRVTPVRSALMLPSRNASGFAPQDGDHHLLGIDVRVPAEPQGELPRGCRRAVPARTWTRPPAARPRVRQGR